MKSRLWIYSSLMPQFDALMLQELMVSFKPITPLIYAGLMGDVVDENPTSIDLYELLIQDLDPRLVMLVMPETLKWIPEPFILDMLSELKPGFYTPEHFLYQISLKSETYRNEIGGFLKGHLDVEMIDTLVKYAVHEMNASKASKALYIHRNTLQYRFSIFEEKTGLDPKAFETIALFHAIFAQ